MEKWPRFKWGEMSRYIEIFLSRKGTWVAQFRSKDEVLDCTLLAENGKGKSGPGKNSHSELLAVFDSKFLESFFIS